MLKASKIALLNNSSPVQLNHSVKAHTQEKRSLAQRILFRLFVSLGFFVTKLSHI